MTIDRLNQVEPIQPKKTTPSPKTERTGKNDSISLSSEAMEKAELFSIMEMAKSAPDERLDRIAEIKARLNDPEYLNDTVLAATAERILDQLL